MNTRGASRSSYIGARMLLLFQRESAQITAFLNHLNSYATPASAQVFAPAAACISLVLFHAEGDIKPLAWGLVVGATAQCLVLAIDLVKRVGVPEIRLSFSSGVARTARSPVSVACSCRGNNGPYNLR